ncbi:MAG: O-antigen ligase family protein [Lachnospirales bacterium]
MKTKENKVSKFDIFVIFTLIGIVPFLMQAITVTMPTATGETQAFDYFNYIKVITIKFVAFLIFINYLLELITNGNNGSLINKQLSLFDNFKHILKSIDKKILFSSLLVISVVLSYIFSDYKYLARFGAYERFEGIWTHFSYVIIFIYSLQFFRKEGAFKVFSYAVLFSAFIVGGIGTLQYFGVDIFNNEILKTLTYKNYDIQINSQGSFTTMYNTNTSASYSILMIYVLFLIAILNTNKGVKIVSVIDLCLLSITVFNSMSEATFIAAAISILVVVVIYIISLFLNGNAKKLKICIISISGIVVLSIVFLFTTGLSNKILDKLSKESTFVKYEQIGNEFIFYNKYNDYIKVVTNDDSYEVYNNEELLGVRTNEDMEYVNVHTDEFSDVEVGNYIADDGNTYIAFNEYFYIVNDYNDPYIVSKNGFEKNVQSTYIGFENYPTAMTNRGYIWSRSIPLLVKNPIFGYGSDAFIDIFPNNDVAIKSFIGFTYILVDKPHSIYLNMWISNGILYLLGFMGIVSIIFYDKFKLLYELKGNNVKRIAICIYIGGMVAYLINGMATDNLVVIVMTFWVYLAISNDVFGVRDEDKYARSIVTSRKWHCN